MELHIRGVRILKQLQYSKKTTNKKTNTFIIFYHT